MQGKTAVVTGGAGFLGSHLCDRLLSEGMKVICLDNLLTGRVQNIEHLFTNENFQFTKLDVTNFIHVPSDVDYVLHFASPASPIDYLNFPIQTLKVGSLGTHKALGLAKEKKSKIFTCINFGSLRRSVNSPSKRRILGECKSCWPPRSL